MEKRKDKRVKTRKVAKINNELCIIVDVSKQGARVSADKIPSFPFVDIIFNVGKSVVNLKGVVCWQSSNHPITKLKDVGVSFETNSIEYKKYLKYLDNLQEE